MEIYTEGQLSAKFGRRTEETEWREKARKLLAKNFSCSATRVKEIVFSLIPILQWLPRYKPTQFLVGDIAGGLTVGIVHLPQGMAYALLASLPAVTGLYVSFFPVLTYVIFGTSKHISVGTFAVICLMIAQVINEHVQPCPDTGNKVTNVSAEQMITASTGFMDGAAAGTVSEADLCQNLYVQRKLEIASALALANGIILIMMSVFRLGIITTLLSDHLVSAFTCAASYHVLTSQVPKLLGIYVDRRSGPLALIYTYIDILKDITTISWPTFLVSACCILLLVAGKIINAHFHDRLPIPLPWEIVVVIFSTIASYFGYFEQNHGVQIVGHIPTGIQTTVPKASDIGLVMLEAIPIVIVAFATHISLSQIFAVKHSYEVDSNQELLAMGFGNVVGSFFSCFPVAASLSRTVIWEEVGAKTQITGVVSSSLILVVLLWIGPLFESLPQAALASIIVVNLKGMLTQFVNVKPLWAVSKLDAVIWIVTWTAVVLLGVELGLVVAVGFQLFSVVLRTQIIKGHVLGDVAGTGYYRNINQYQTRPTINVIPFRFPGPLYFANKERFKQQICDVLGFDPVLKAAKKDKDDDELSDLGDGRQLRRTYSATDNQNFDGVNRHEENTCNSPGANSHSSLTNNATQMSQNDSVHSQHHDQKLISAADEAEFVDQVSPRHRLDSDTASVTHLVMDMSACFFIDNDGVKMINALYTSLLELDITLALAACNEHVRKAITIACSERRPPYFVSVNKAVEFAQGEAVIEMDGPGNDTERSGNVEDTTL